MISHRFSLFIAIVMAGGCAIEGEFAEPAEIATSEAALATDDAAAADAFVLHVSGAPFSTITVSHKNANGDTVHESCKTCDMAFLSGTRLTIRVTFPKDDVNCMLFQSWQQSPCAGQGSTCTTTIRSNISATARWTRWLGCQPQ